jgi:hypothetical protein
MALGRKNMISMISDLKKKHGVCISEGELFKQALYNGRLRETSEQVRDKIELAVKHYQGKDLLIGTYESDVTSTNAFVYVVVTPT